MHCLHVFVTMSNLMHCLHVFVTMSNLIHCLHVFVTMSNLMHCLRVLSPCGDKNVPKGSLARCTFCYPFVSNTNLSFLFPRVVCGGGRGGGACVRFIIPASMSVKLKLCIL